MKSRIVVAYSYPSSPNAVRFGFAASSCWTVQRENADGSIAYSGHATEEEAKTAADARRRDIRNKTNRDRNACYADLGLRKVRGSLGGTYFE